MKKNLFIFMALVTIFSIALFGFGCGKTPTQDETVSLEQLLSGAKKPTELSYDIHSKYFDGTEITSKVYLKGTKMRNESEMQGKKIIMLGDTTATMYAYYPDENMAMQIDSNEEQKQGNIEEDPFEMVDELMDSAVIIGTETIDGKKCTVVEYKISEQDVEITQKAWIWEKYGMVIKVETTSSEGAMTMEFKNINIGNISDDLFELPAGVNIIDMQAMMQGGLSPEALEALQGLAE